MIPSRLQKVKEVALVTIDCLPLLYAVIDVMTRARRTFFAALGLLMAVPLPGRVRRKKQILVLVIQVGLEPLSGVAETSGSRTSHWHCGTIC
jgi:hypothetical protein